MDNQLRDKRALQQDLRSAIARDELELHYQPQATIGGEILGFEALVRWHHPRSGMVSPGTVHPARRGKRPHRAARRMDPAHRLPGGGVLAAPLRIAVNLSPVQFRTATGRLVHPILLETGLEPPRLELEITEGVLIGDFTRAAVGAAPPEERSACASRWTISAPAIRRCPICSRSRSTRSRSTRASSPISPHSQQSAAIVRAVIGLAAASICRWWRKAWRPKSSSSSSPAKHCNEIQGYPHRPAEADRGLCRRGRARAGAEDEARGHRLSEAARG